MRTDPSYVQPLVAVRTLRLRRHLAIPGCTGLRNLAVVALGLASGAMGAALAASI